MTVSPASKVDRTETLRPPWAARWQLLACAVSAQLVYGAASSQPLLAGLALCGTVFAWWLTEGGLGRPLPRLVVSLMTFTVLMIGLYRTVALGPSVEVFSELIMLLLVVKLFDVRRSRDRNQAVVLSISLLVGAVLTNSTIWVGLLGMTQLATLALLVPSLVLHRAEEQAEHASRAPWGVDSGGAERGPGATGEARRRPGLTRMSLGIAAVAFAIGLIVFVITPRGIQTRPFGNLGQVSVGQVTGFNDEITLGRGGLISESPTPVLDLGVRVRDADGTERNVGGSGQRFYLRGAVLTSYSSGRWARPTEVAELMIRAGRVRQQALGLRPREATLIQSVSIRNSQAGSAHLFSVWRPLAIRFESPVRMRYAWTEGQKLAEDGQLIIQSGGGRIEYEVRSLREPREPDVVQRRDGVSFDSDVLRAFAEGVLNGAGIEPDPSRRAPERDAEAADEIERAFRTGFRYTLETLAAPPGADPIEWFLTDRREGHCEYFASAMALACRSVGIPARVVTGYVATEFSEATGRYIVRESNAHAWVEVETSLGVWRTYDPTPPAELRRIHEPSSTLAGRARRWFDSIEMAWIQGVVAYDADTQTGVLGGPMRALGLNPRDWTSPSAERLRRGPAVAAGGIILLLCGGVALAIWQRHAIARLWARFLGGAVSGRGRRGPRDPRLRALLDEIERGLADGRGDELRSVPLLRRALDVPDLGRRETLLDAVRVYYQARFGASPDTQAAVRATRVLSKARRGR